MKVTVKNLQEKWSEIEKYLNNEAHDTYNSGFIKLVKKYDANPDIKKSLDQFIDDINIQLADVDATPKKPKYEPAKYDIRTYTPKHHGKKREKKTEPAVVAVTPTEKTEQESLTPTSKSGSADITIVPYGNGLLVYGEGTMAIKEKLKAIGGTYGTLRRKDKPANLKKGWTFKAVQKAEIERVINGEIKKENVETIKIDDQKYNVDGPIKLEVILEDQIVETTKSGRGKIAEAPNWLKTLRTFVNSCGKEKTVTSIRKQVLDIHDRFDARRRRSNAHIELIREIQKCLLPYANTKNGKKVHLPNWESLVDRCKTAIKSVVVTSKLSKRDMTEIELSGTSRRRSTRRRTTRRRSRR